MSSLNRSVFYILILISVLYSSVSTAAPTFIQDNLEINLVPSDVGTGVINIKAPGLKDATVFHLADPNRIVVDLSGINVKANRSFTVPSHPFIKDLRIGKHTDKTRVVLDISSIDIPLHSWKKTNEGIVLGFNPSETKPIAEKHPVIPLPTIFSTPIPVKTSPTVSPTAFPTIKTTGAPTVKPTDIPTAMPTAISTPKPLPTAAPTVIASPTIIPALTPTTPKPQFTFVPTEIPTPVLESATALPTPIIDSATIKLPVTPAATPVDTVVDGTRAMMLSKEDLAAKGQYALQITFNPLQDKDLPTFQIHLTRRPEFRFTRKDPKNYIISIPDCSAAGEYFLLPLFPPHNFVGITHITSNQRGKDLEILVGVDSGTKLQAVTKGEGILVKALSPNDLFRTE